MSLCGAFFASNSGKRMAALYRQIPVTSGFRIFQKLRLEVKLMNYDIKRSGAYMIPCSRCFTLSFSKNFLIRTRAVRISMYNMPMEAWEVKL